VSEGGYQVVYTLDGERKRQFRHTFGGKEVLLHQLAETGATNVTVNGHMERIICSHGVSLWSSCRQCNQEGQT